MITNACLRNARVSDRTLWRHVVLKAGDHVGVGEFTLDSAGSELDAEASAIANSLIGTTASAGLAETLGALRQRDLKGAAIVSAVDQALHDLLARAAGVPLAEHLGHHGDDTRIPLYANINRRTVDRTPSGFRESASSARETGFDAIKLAPFDGMSPTLAGTRESAALIKRALERIQAVRDALGSEAPILLDCHWRLTQRMVRDILPDLTGMGVTWLECPLPERPSAAAEIAALRLEANELGIRLAGCESMTLWEGFSPFVQAGAYDVIMPDVKYVGGFAALRDVVERAWRHGVTISLHNPSGPISYLHSLHACVALGLTERLEIQFDETPLFATIIQPPPPPGEAGSARIPADAGLGATLIKDPAFEWVSSDSSFS